MSRYKCGSVPRSNPPKFPWSTKCVNGDNRFESCLMALLLLLLTHGHIWKLDVVVWSGHIRIAVSSLAWWIIENGLIVTSSARHPIYSLSVLISPPIRCIWMYHIPSWMTSKYLAKSIGFYYPRKPSNNELIAGHPYKAIFLAWEDRPVVLTCSLVVSCPILWQKYTTFSNHINAFYKIGWCIIKGVTTHNTLPVTWAASIIFSLLVQFSFRFDVRVGDHQREAIY